ncbi:hypothetical protein PFISCL1PPCAC_18659, partial [Pristionchus fissidentatus]
DYRLYEEAVSEFRKMGVEISAEENFALIQSCERAKRTLSSCDQAEIEHFDKNGKRYSYTIKRETFEELCQDLFEKTINCVKEAIRESKCPKEKIDDVVLVGGSSRIPRVHELLRELFGSTKLKFDIPPDHAVGHGAAILAASLSRSGDSGIAKLGGGAVRLADVTPFTLSTDIIYDRVSVLIPRNSPYPTSKSEGYTNAREFITQINSKILEGEHAMASKNNVLGSVTIPVEKKPINGNHVKVTFAIDENGILNVHVKDDETGKEVETTVKTSMITVSERNEMVKNARQRAAEEEVEREKFKARTAFADALMRVKVSVHGATSEEKGRAMKQIIAREEEWIEGKDRPNDELYKHAESIRTALSQLRI